MRASDYKPFFIISAELSTNTIKQNERATARLNKELERSPYCFKRIVGSYKGVREASFIVFSNSDQVAKSLRKTYKQESVLIRNQYNDCILSYADGKAEYLGSFTKVSEKEALTHDAYSVIAGEYYVVTSLHKQKMIDLPTKSAARLAHH